MMPALEAVLMTEPPPPSTMSGIPCLQNRKMLRKLIEITLSHTSSSMSVILPS